MTTTSRLYDLLYDAQAELFNAIEHLEEYVRLTSDRQAQIYVVDQLKIIASRDHDFLARDLNLDDLMEQLDDENDNENDVNYPDQITRADGTTIYLLRNNNGPILDTWGNPRYVTLPTD